MNPIDFILDTDLGEFRDAVRRFIRESATDGIDDATLWRNIGEQGWVDALLDRLTPALRMLLMLNAELGRAARVVPLAETVALPLALRGAKAPDPALVALADERVATAIAVVGAGSCGRDEFVRMNGVRIDARLCNVEHIALAHRLLIVDPQQGRVAACALPATGMRAQSNIGFADPPWQDLQLHSVSGKSASLGELTSRLLTILRLAATAHAWGAAACSVEELSEYVKIREQFGQPVGRFQSMQHRLARLHTTIAASRLLLGRAATALDDDEPQWQAHADAACAYAGPALRELALECHHGFGAVGYMEEHSMPRRFRHLHADLVRHTAGSECADALARHLLDGGADFITARIALGERTESLRQEVVDWLAIHWNESHRDQHRRLGKPAWQFDRGFLEAIGRKGWIGLTIPQAVGGQGLGPLEQFVFDEELSFREAPIYSYTTAQLLAPSLLRFGTEEQRARFLPLMLEGKAVFCLGYSEPNAGSDLASLKTRAVREGDEWVINGAKIWTTLGTVGDYVWLAARTNPEAPRHTGISVFIIPLKTPGISIRPLDAMNGQHPCAMFYDNVRVPADALVGEVDQGWKVITSALAQERMIMGGFAAKLALHLQRLIDALRSPTDAQRKRWDAIGLQPRLGRFAAEVQASRLLALQATVTAAGGRMPVAEAAVSKVFTSELEEQLAEAALDWLGPDALLRHDAPAAVLDGMVEHSLLMGIMHVVGGGSNDIQRNIIAQVGQGLPR